MPDPVPVVAPDPQSEMEKQAAIRRLTMALAMQPQTPGLQQAQQGGLPGGLAQGIQQGQNWRMQGDLNKAMGIESPFDKLMKLFGGGGSPEVPPGSMTYGGPR